jgi:heat shock protein HspQ
LTTTDRRRLIVQIDPQIAQIEELLQEICANLRNLRIIAL